MKGNVVWMILGVSGSGKTTIGQALAAALRVPFVDADDYHSAANRDKMARGEPLTDEDRWPWLDAFAEGVRHELRDSEIVIGACSALRRVYRRRLEKALGKVRWIWLDVSEDVLHERVTRRAHDFMPPSLLQSQLATLEPPRRSVRVDGDRPASEVVPAILRSTLR